MNGLVINVIKILLLLFEFVFYIVYFYWQKGIYNIIICPLSNGKYSIYLNTVSNGNIKNIVRKIKKLLLSDDFIYFETERKIEISLNKDTETVAEILSGLPKKYINGIFIEYNK